METFVDSMKVSAKDKKRSHHFLDFFKGGMKTKCLYIIYGHYNLENVDKRNGNTEK